jgi:hypothetical protein
LKQKHPTSYTSPDVYELCDRLRYVADKWANPKTKSIMIEAQKVLLQRETTLQSLRIGLDSSVPRVDS